MKRIMNRWGLKPNIVIPFAKFNHEVVNEIKENFNFVVPGNIDFLKRYKHYIRCIFNYK